MKIIISRTDAIGDVILTLPLVVFLKKKLENVEIFFLASRYTKPILESCEFIDKIIDYNDLQELDEVSAIEKLKQYNANIILHIFPNSHIAKLAKRAAIPVRVGTRNRFFHWWNCNKLIKLSRKNSDLHEAQLNLTFAKYFGLSTDVHIDELANLYGFSLQEELQPEFANLLAVDKQNVILHPKSNLSAREWGIDNFNKLVKLLPDANIFITGTEKEREAIESQFDFSQKNVTNLIGKFSLYQLIAFISKCDVLVAASTGPLHIAAFTGINAIGLFPPTRPMHAGRWAPIGEKAKYFTADEEYSEDKNSSDCLYLKGIAPEEIASYIKKLSS